MSWLVKRAVKWIGRMIAMSLPVAAAATIGGQLAAVLVGMLVVLLLALCWVLSDPDRSYRLTRMICACTGTQVPRPADPDQAIHEECPGPDQTRSLAP